MPDAWENLVPAEQAAMNRNRPGAYTFNQRPPEGYEGPITVLGVGGLGDHAHVLVETGSSVNGDLNVGVAGTLIMPWREWLRLRKPLEGTPGFLIAEVRRASAAQVESVHPDWAKQ